MMDPITVAGAGAIANSEVGKEVGKALVLPLAEKLGNALADLGDIYWFYQTECLSKIFTRWAAARNNKPLSQEDFRKILPLLQLASVQSDEELQAKWAALLENTVTGVAGILPSFGQTLSQLTSEEARFLDRIFEFVSQPTGYLSERRPGMVPMDSVRLINIYDSSINTGINPAEREAFKDRMSEEQLRNYDKLTQAELVIQDLERLGIITQEQRAEPNRYLGPDTIKIPAGRSAVFQREYSLTQYGISFILAVARSE
jgi:hypothetical protein